MELVRIRIEIDLHVDNEIASQIRSSPPGFLCLNNEPLGSADLTFNVLNGHPIETSRVEVTVIDT